MKKNKPKSSKNLNDSVAEKLSNILENQEEFSEYFSLNQEKEKFIYDLFNKIANSDSLEEAGMHISKNLCTLTGFDECFLRILDDRFQILLENRASYSKNPKSKRKEAFYDKLDKDFRQNVFGSQKPYIIEDVSKMATLLDLKRFLKKINVKSEIVIPIYCKNKPLGVFVLSNIDKTLKLKKEKVSFLEFLVPLISVCISTFYLNEKYEKNLLIEKTTQEIINKLKNIKEKETLFDFILEKLVSAFNVDNAARFNFGKNNELIVKNFSSKSQIDKDEIPNIELNKLFSNINNYNTIIINDIQKEILNEYIKEYMYLLDTQAILIYPNLFNSQLLKSYKEVGFIMLMKKTKKKWSSDEVYWFQLIIDTINIALKDYEETQKAEDSKKDFIATLAHDLKSPLLAEEKILESILCKSDDTKLEEIRPWMEAIIKNNKELLSMISNLLSMYHYERSKYELDVKPFIYTSLIEESVEILRYLSNDKKISIKINYPKEDIKYVKGDKSAIKRVLSNILSNAIKYTRENGTINISIKEENKCIVTCIQDEGPGITQEEAQEIFNPYKSKKSTLGRGLGLHIAKNIVETHHGNIWIEKNMTKKGSAFCFTLPIENKI